MWIYYVYSPHLSVLFFLTSICRTDRIKYLIICYRDSSPWLEGGLRALLHKSPHSPKKAPWLRACRCTNYLGSTSDLSDARWTFVGIWMYVYTLQYLKGRDRKVVVKSFSLYFCNGSSLIHTCQYIFLLIAGYSFSIKCHSSQLWAIYT